MMSPTIRCGTWIRWAEPAGGEVFSRFERLTVRRRRYAKLVEKPSGNCDSSGSLQRNSIRLFRWFGFHFEESAS